MGEISIIHNEALSSALKVDVLDLQYVAPYLNNNASNAIDVKKLRINFAVFEPRKS